VTKYEISVKRYDVDEVGADTWEELFTLAGPRDVVARGVAMAAEVLGASSASIDGPSAPVSAVQTSSPTGDLEQQTEADKPKRTRRTKAQIEADKAAELASATQAAGDALQQHANSLTQGATPPPAPAAWPAPGSMPAQAFPPPAAQAVQPEGQTAVPAYSPFGPPAAS